MRRELEMGRKVSQRAYRQGQALGCYTCGIGKAIDDVGREYGEPAYDWAGLEAKRCGRHICKNTTWNLNAALAKPAKYAPDATVINDAEANVARNKIAADLAEWQRQEARRLGEKLDDEAPF